MRKTVYVWMVLLATLLSSACNDGVQKPAPVGEYAVLEQLAEAYRSMGQQYPMQPQSMKPEGRKEFLSKVFAQAGYSYSATLLSVTKTDLSATNQDHRDLVDLLLLPSKGLADADLASIYSTDELVAVRHLRAVFR